VAEAARPYWDQWFGNPSSGHAYGERPRQAVARAREQVAALIGAAAGEIVFTDQLAIRGAVLAGLRAAPGGTPRVITQVTEHPAVLACCQALERWHGAQVTRLPVDGLGLVDPQAVADARARPARARGPAVVSVMLANNETGAMQPSPRSRRPRTRTAPCYTSTPPRPPARPASTSPPWGRTC
jgi:cysteine desulfurase